MSAATPLAEEAPAPAPIDVTLLELVRAVSEVADTETEVIATVIHMLHSGSARLIGSFRGCRLD